MQKRECGLNGVACIQVDADVTHEVATMMSSFSTLLSPAAVAATVPTGGTPPTSPRCKGPVAGDPSDEGFAAFFLSSRLEQTKVKTEEYQT